MAEHVDWYSDVLYFPFFVCTSIFFFFLSLSLSLFVCVREWK